MRYLAWLAVGLVCVGSFGCRAEGDDPGTTPHVDSGPPPGDDGGTTDATRPPTGDGDVPDPDGGTPSCPCAALPATCSAPAPNVPTFTPEDDALQRQLFDVVACASTTLQIASYEVLSDCVVDRLLERLTAAPSLELQIVADNDQCPRDAGGVLMCPLSRLDGNPRVTIVEDDRDPYMHHKFVIGDGERMWVGSANLSNQSFCTDHNNALVIEQPEIVAAYQAEFQRLFTDRDFGPLPAGTAPTEGGSMTVYFGPVSPLTDPSPWFNEIINAIGSATTSVDFIMFAFTRDEISEALVAAQSRGVAVRGIVDSSYARDPAVLVLTSALIPLRAGNIHDKSMIIDGRLVVTGSPNWSMNSWANNENSLWINDTTVATYYRAEFERLYSSLPEP